jgi:hypothetical protein
MNLPERLPLPHPFSPQRQLFTVPRHLSIGSCIELRRTPYKKPKTYWKPFGNMGAKPSLDMSAAGNFRIASVAFPEDIIASTMSIPKCAAAREMQNGSSSSKILAEPTIPAITTGRSSL